MQAHRLQAQLYKRVRDSSDAGTSSVRRLIEQPAVKKIKANTSADDVLRKVGRNVVLFQKIEGMLKSLSHTASYAGSPADIRAQHERHVTSLRKKSFGQVVSLFFEQVYTDAESSEPLPRPGPFAFRFNIRGRERSQLKEALEALVNERNELIHTRLLGFDGYSEGDCCEMEAFLDAQHQRLKPTFTMIVELVVMMENSRPVIAEAIEDEIRSHGDEQDA